MKLYYSKGACSLAVRILIHEMGIPCEFIAANIKTKKLENGDDFLKINPKGMVPALMLDNGEVLTENPVIQQYLADEYKATALLPPVGNLNRYRVLEWLNFVSSDIHKGFGPLFNPKMPVLVKEEIVKPALNLKFDWIDQHLSKNKFLMRDTYTLPDGYLFVMLFWFPHFKMKLSKWKNLLRYFVELKQRKSIHQSNEYRSFGRLYCGWGRSLGISFGGKIG
jgi:glutathione S-transferase